jgi:hypothetical protein
MGGEEEFNHEATKSTKSVLSRTIHLNLSE